MDNPAQKIIIHALGATMGGAMRHLTNFLPELGQVDKSREYIVLVRESFPALDVPENILLERVLDKECSSWFGRIYSDLFKLPKRLKKEEFSAIVSLTNFGPVWSPIPHVFFQRNALYYYPDFFNSLSGFANIEMALRRRLAIESMKRADVIVTPSNTMNEMIREVCPAIKKKKFKTLYHGINTNDWKIGDDSELPGGFEDGDPVLFFPSHLAEFKGYRFLFDVVAQLIGQFPKLKLVLTISHEDNPALIDSYHNRITQLKINKNILMIGRVAQNKIKGIYTKSDIMLYPSMCESFGFSMLEAMGARLPIVAVDTRINREICKSAAIYFSPSDIKGCAEQITKLLLDASAKNSLLLAAEKRLTDFDWSWRRNALDFVSIIEGLEL